MYCLTEQQVDFILNDIRRRGVEMEDLQLNLLDHVCCMVEQNLKEGEDFEACYAQTIPRFFKHELWEIEQETIILLTFKNYYAMKKTMIISGSISVATFLLGSFFKIMYWPGANVCLLTAIVCFTFLFLPLLFIVKSRDTHKWQDKLLIAVSVLAGMLYATTSLFSVMHWPFRTPLWISTSAFALFVLVPTYFFVNIKKEGNKINTIITTIILTGATGVLFLMINLRPSRALELCNFNAIQDAAATQQFMFKQSETTFAKLQGDTSNKAKQYKELHIKSKALYNQVEKLKLSLINALRYGNDTTIVYSSLFSAYLNEYMRSTYMLFDDNDEPKPLLCDVKADINAFNSFVKEKYNISSFGMLNTSGSVEIDGDGKMIPWENFNFYKVPFYLVLRNLSEIQIEILTIESACIK